MKNRVYERLMDDESRVWYESRVQYAESGDVFKLYDAIYQFHKKELLEGWGINELQDECYKGKSIIVFGTGNYGKHTFYVLQHSSFAERIIAFADNDVSKQGKKFCGFDVLVPSELVEKHRDALVIIASEKYHIEMYMQLVTMDFPQYNIFLPKRRTLTEGIAGQYFDMFAARSDEIFIDAGAYDGETTVNFARWCGGNYKKIYLFEPSRLMRDTIACKLEEYNIERYDVINKAVWSKEERLLFSNDVESTASTAGCVCEDSDWSVDAVSIDAILEGGPATFIKMDVEGSELEALKGARETIMKYRPRLAISIYHKPEDIYEIPAYILSLVPDYELYIRHYSTDVFETVLYAV